jgi:hypothetical protein
MSRLPIDVAADDNWRLGYRAGLHEVRSGLAVKGIALALGAWLFTRPGGLVWKCAAVAVVMWLVLLGIEWWPVTLTVIAGLTALYLVRHRRARRPLHARERPFA